MEIKSKQIELVAIEKIIPNPKNPNKHPQEQIDRLAKIIDFQGFRVPLIVSNRSGFLVSGHGRLDCAKSLGVKELPVMFQDFESEAQEYAFVVSDNEIQKWAATDLSMVNLEMLDLGPDFDIDMLGIKDFSLDLSEKKESNYSDKIEVPIYEPSQNKPKLMELYDNSKTLELVKEIDESGLDKDIKEFLIISAARHTVFNYQKIADFYAHSDEKIKNLAEKSALVIIDYDKAIENGFVKMSKQMAEAYDENE